nr:uncharacterized protein LOC118972328 isoform X2 [Manis javanica]
MSSPLASLGKTRRVPLQSEPVNSGLGWRPGTQGLTFDDTPGGPNLSVFLLLLAWIPRRQGIKIYRDEDEVDVLNDGHGLEEKISIPSCNSGIGAPASRQASTQFAVPSVADHPSSGPPHDPSPWWLPASHAPSSQLTFPGPAFPPSSSV